LKQNLVIKRKVEDWLRKAGSTYRVMLTMEYPFGQAFHSEEGFKYQKTVKPDRIRAISIFEDASPTSSRSIFANADAISRR
jgi:hypothetical protein